MKANNVIGPNVFGSRSNQFVTFVVLNYLFINKNIQKHHKYVGEDRNNERNSLVITTDIIINRIFTEPDTL